MDYVYSAKVIRVVSHREVDLSIDLGFYISKRDTLLISGYDVPFHLENSAKACLILLVGGHRVVIRTGKKDGVVSVELFIGGKPIVNNITEVVGGSRLTNVNKIMRLMQEKEFDSDFIAARLGKRK